MQEIKSFYSQRSETYAQQATNLHQRYDRFSWVRLGIFVVGIALIILFWSLFWLIGVLSIFVLLYGFYRFVQWHQKMKIEADYLQQLSDINAAEMRVLEHDYQTFDGGKEFVDAQHPYTFDLDIFGDYSLFQYLNRTSTILGKTQLANLLSESVDIPTIEARQKAIQELADLVDWRQQLQAYGKNTDDQQTHVDLLLNWLETPPLMLNNRLYQISLYVAPILAVIALILAFFTPWFIAILPLLFNAYILRRSVMQVNDIHRQTTHAEAALSRYANLIQHIENQNFSSPLLQQSTAAFTTHAAYQQIKRLSYLITQLNVRYNVFAFVLNIAGLWDLQWTYRLEKWKEKNKTYLPAWFEELARFEALSSFGNLCHNRPDFTFPEFHERASLAAESLGHPLIAAEERVNNDFSSPTSGHIKLITGSNMAGKSTFLRAVGVNIMLANIGSPVCAKAFRLPVLNVYTSMRTQDALHESTSSFYAELKRLKFIIEAVDRGEPIYFLLDEILKGTNSRDRHTGSKALIRQLIEAKGGGIIATHDLELGALEVQYGGAIENLRIEVEIEDGKLHFDYLLKKGVSESFNATLLMQQMGIRIKE